MAKPKQALLDLQKKYGVRPERDEKEEEQAAQPASSFQQTQVKSSPKSALDNLKKKYAENPKAWNETSKTEPVVTTELRNPTFKDLTINSLKQGYYNSIYGQESYKDMTGAANSKDYYEQLLAGDDYQFEADNWWEKAISGAANLLGQQARQWSDPRSIAAGATFATGAAAMGQAGPQVLVPEEIVTVPSAFIAGMTAGSTASNFEIEAGLAYNEMIESGISESTAKKIALGVGGVNAGLEMAQLDELAKAFKILDKSGAHKKVTRRLVDELKDRGIDIAKETVQEVMQEGSTIAGTQIGSKMETGDWAYDTKEVLGRLGETAMSSALSFGVMNAPAGVINSANIVSTNKQLGDVGGEYQVAVKEVISEGLSMPENTEAYQTAKALKAKMDAGQTITDAELGKAVVDNERAIQVSRANTPTETPQETLENLARETVTQQENAQQAQPVQREYTPYNVMAEDNPVRQQRIAEVKNLERKLGYGEEGMKAFNSILESGNQSIEQVRTNFQSAYEAGMTNLPREKANLIDSTQETAYNAGRMDAIKSMKKAEVKGATVWGKEGGLIQNEYSSKLDATTADTLQMIGKATGIKIIMKDQVFGGLANGSYKDGVVTIAADARNPYIVVAKHEVTHRMQDLASKQYTAYRDYAVQIMAGSGSKTTLVEQYQARAARDNVYLTAELAMDEIAADFTERILTDEKALNDFVNHASKNNDTRTMGQKFFHAVREFINKVKRIFKGDRKKMDKAAQEQYGTTIAQLEKAEALWKEAYRAAEERAQSADAAKKASQDGVVQNSLKSIDYVNQAKNRTDAMVRLYETDGVRYSMKELPTEEAPKKTKTAYKLFRVDPNRPGEIFPLFVGAEDSIPIGKWIAAEDNESVATLGHWTGTGAKKRFVEDKVRRVKSKIGESWLLDPSQFKEWEQGKTYAVGSRVQYNGHVYVVTKKSNFVSNVAPDMKGSGWKQSDTMTTMAYRPGWHSGDAPYLEHIGKRPNGATKVTHYAANHIWAEVEVPDDIDYQPQANERGMDANGKIREKFADLDYIPTGGNYEYKTNSNMLGKWVISGAIRVTRILSDAETRQMLSTQFADRGLTQRRRMNDSFEEVGDIDLAKFGFEEGKQYSLKGDANQNRKFEDVTFNGKKFWMGVADRNSGKIMRTWTETEAAATDYQEYALLHGLPKGDYVFFTTDLLQDNDRIEYDDYGVALPKALADRINEQISVNYSTIKSEAAATDKKSENRSAIASREADKLYRQLLVGLGAGEADAKKASFSEYISNAEDDTLVMDPISSLLTYVDDMHDAKVEEYTEQGMDESEASERAERETASLYDLVGKLSSIVNKKTDETKFSLKDDPMKMEQDLDSLRQQREELQDEIDVAYLDDLPQADINKLENRMVKLNAEIDKLVAQERKATVKTSMNDILSNLSRYRRSDLESLAEQISDGNWDGYEDLSRSELEDALREEIEAMELSPLEMQSTKMGLYVRPASKDTGAQFSLKAGDEGATYEENGKKYSLKSLRHDITEGKMFDDLVAAKVFTTEEAGLFKENLEKLISYMLPNASILDMNEAYTKDNRPFSSYKPNSDPLYKISLDFSTLCRKRLMTQYVIEQLQLRENRPMSAEEQIAIRSMLLDYRQQEKALQVACAMCYVEAARLKAPKQMEKFFNETESIMRKHFAKKDKTFNDKVRAAQAQFKVDRGYDADATKKEMSGKDTKALNDMSAKMRKGYTPNAEQQAIIDKAVSLPRSTFLTAANLTALSIDHPEIYDAYTSHIRASTRSKSLEGDVPYYYGDSVGPVSDSFIEGVNAENGMRFDSWSDFQMKHMLDMITAVIDLSVRKSKMHGYTKFPEMVRIFGKTGMMFNLSGVTEGNGFDANGNLVFSDTESIDINEAIKLRKMFPETAGMQCIGVSDDHIRALLRADFIDYVIPYHTSGMNATLRKMAGIYEWDDYTQTQHATKNPKAKKPANADDKWQVEPVWSEFYVAEGKDGYDIMQKTAQRYIDMCHERGLIPKFNDFTNEDGYWKLLVDRKMINQETGQIIEQQPVKPIFDFDLIEREIDNEVDHYDPALEEKALKYVVDNFDAVNQRIKDLKKGHPKKSMLTMGNEILQAYARGTNNTTQHSLKGQDDLLKQNAKLKEVNQELRNQFKTTKFAKVDKKSLDRFTKQLLKDYSSGADINSTREALDDLYTYMANGEDGGVPSWDEAYMRAYNAATDILSNASMMDDEMFQAYKSLRDDLNTTGISIDKRYDHDLIGYESINEFRKANFGRIKLTNDGTPVDVLYEELAYRYPEFFDSDAHMNQADQLSHIEEVLNSLQPTEVNPYSHNMREAATWLANDIMERFFELPQAKPTFADKAERKLAKQKAKDAEKLQLLRAQKNERIASLIVENRARLAVAVSDERMAADSAIKKLKDKYAEKEAKASENKKASILRTKIIRHAQEMSQTLLRPSDKHHIPQALRAPVAELLDSINLESQYTIDPATGKRQKNVPGDPTKRTLAFTRLRKAYQDIIQEDGADIVVDPAIEAMLDRVIEMRDVKLADMTVSQLADVWQVVRVMEHTINTAGKLLSYSKYERTMEWADAMVEDTETRRSKRGTKAEAIRIDMENPYTFFSHYGDAGKDVFRMLRDAQDKQQLMVNNVQEKVQAIVDPKTVRNLEKEVHVFTTERGAKLTLTKAQIMDIYLLTKREQAQEHLMQGGIVQPEVESKKIKRGTDAILLTINDLTAITNKLTVKEREIAIKLQMLTRTTLADYGNAASMKAYGYKKFTGEDYWPIKSAREGIHSNVEKGGNNTRSIKNIGLAKTVMPHASNPLDIGGIFKTFASHSADMIDYAAWLCPMEDANRLFNFQFRDEGGNRTGKTIKGLLDRVGGNGAQQYWHNLMEDIQNGLKSQADNTMIQPINKVIGNVRGASVGANIRVIIQQPTAILRAAAVLSPEAMFRGLFVGGGWKTALKHSPIAMRKDMGGFDISSPMQMNEILFDSKTGLQRFNEAMMWGAGKADAVTWGRIWNACESEVLWDRKDLTYKTDDFYKAVNELFNEVIDQSQVVDGVLQRSQLMRSNNALMNQATAFMGEPTMTMNMMLRAYDNLRNETDKSKRGKAIKTFGRTAFVLLATNAVNALAQSLIDAVRDDEDEEYWKKFWNAFTGITGEEETAWEKATGAMLGGNLGSGMNPVGYIPFAKDLVSILQGYNVTRADADIAGDIIDATKTFIESVGGDGKKTIGRATFDLAKQVGKVFGVSAFNIERDVWGIARTIALETGNIPLQYEMEKAIYKNSNEKNDNRFADILYKAYMTDKDVYQHIYDDLVASGMAADSIKDKMENRMKKDQGTTKVTELEYRYLHPDQQSAYDSKMKGIQNSSLWKNASAEQKDELEESLYHLVTDSKTGLELQAEIESGKSYGLDETEFLLYDLALAMVDQPNSSGDLGGTPTASEKAAAIAKVGNLDDGDIAYLWDTDQALEAFAYGIDMDKYAQFKGVVGNFKGDTKQKQIDQYLRQMGVSTKEYLYLMGTVYSSYKKRKDYIAYFGKQD